MNMGGDNTIILYRCISRYIYNNINIYRLPKGNNVIE